MLQVLAFPAAVSVLNISIALLVYSRNPRHWVNRSFGFFAAAVAGWTLSTALGYQLAGTQAGLFWGRCAFLMGGSCVAAMVVFCHVFPFRAALPASPAIQIFSGSAGAMAILSLSPWVLGELHKTEQGVLVAYGPLYPVFALHVIGCVGYSLTLLIRRTVASKGLERQQLKYLFLALIVPGILATTTNVIIPLTTGYSGFGQYGPLVSVMMVALMAHAIIRHRIMDVRVVVRRGFVYLAASGIAGGLFVTAVAVMAMRTSGDLRDVPLPLQVLVALTIALAFQPIKGWLQQRLDKYVYRESYDYQQVIRQASRSISAILDLATLSNYLCEVTQRIVRPDVVAVLIRDVDASTLTEKARLAFEHREDGSRPPLILASTNALSTMLEQTGRPVLREAAGETVPIQEAQEARSELLAIGADCAIPMLSENRLVGLLVLGPKLSGDAYFSDDIEILGVLANQAAIAVNNAQLFGQVVLVNEHIENILRTMDSGVITVDRQGRVALSNETAERLTGLNRTRLENSSLDRLPEPLASQLRATLVDGIPRLQTEMSLPIDSARMLPIVASTAGLRDQQGGVTGALIVFSDLSKLKALEADKRRAERLAAFGTLVSGIAHEIKNPLVAIRTFAELLPERFLETDFREDFSKVVITEIDRIDDLVARLRGLAAPSPAQVGPVDIREPLSDTLSLLRGQFEQTRTVVEREFSDAQPRVLVDSPQLKQLFLNLLLNAIEAMGTDGRLHIRVLRKQAANETWIVVEVSDTGPGIPESIRASIFDPFFTTKPRGSGLGLAICRGITDAHKGSIRAEAGTPPYTTRIVVEFPAGAPTGTLATQEAILRT